MFHHRKETLILAVPILFGRQINTGKFAEAVRSGIQVIRERQVMSWMWGYSLFVFIFSGNYCNYFWMQDWFTARRELSKSDMAHDATWLLTLFLSNNFEVWKSRAVLACLAQGFLRYRGAEGWTFANS